MICCLSEQKEIKAIIFFPLHQIALLNRIEIESHCIVIGVNRIALLAASYVSSVYCIVGYASRCVSHRPQLWRCTSLISMPFIGLMDSYQSLPFGLNLLIYLPVCCSLCCRVEQCLFEVYMFINTCIESLRVFCLAHALLN